MNRSVLSCCLLYALLLSAACSPAGSSQTTVSSREDTFSPLGDLLGTSGEMLAVSDVGRARKYQNAVAECMSARGFEYIPFVVEDVANADASPTNRRSRPEMQVELAKEIGYGISTNGVPLSTPRAFYQVDGDPNIAVVSKMSAAERTSYEQALVGFSTSNDLSDSSGDPLPVDSSPCQAVAQSELESEVGALKLNQVDPAQLKQFDPMWAEFSKMQSGVAASSEMVEPTRTWSDCMADLSWPEYMALDEPRNEISADWADMNGYKFVVETDGSTTNVVANEQTGPKLPDAAEWEALTQREISLATADYSCRIDYEHHWNQARIAMEIKFIEEHAVELEAWRNLVLG